MTVRADGRIESVETCAAPDGRPGVEFYAGVLVPGLINVHCHLELSYLRGAIAQGGGFAAFARSMGRVRGQFSEQERTAAIAAADARMWAEGMQAVGDVANGNSTFCRKARSRLSYRTFAEVFGLHTDSTDEQRRLLRYPETSLTPPTRSTPCRMPFSGRSARRATHRSRSISWKRRPKPNSSNSAASCGSGTERRVLRAISCITAPPARRIVESVPADRSVILVHNCCVNQQDIDLIMNHFTAPVWWCLCPGSNRYISRLVPPVELFRRNGLNICLGTDSLASNTALSLLGEMQHLGKIPLAELLTWAAPNGARALGFSEPGRGRCGQTARAGGAVRTGLRLDDAHARIVHRTDSLIG